MTLTTQVISGLRWNVVARVIAQGITWAVTLVVMRLLNPADYGLLAMAAVFVGYLSVLTDLGMGRAIVQAPDLKERQVQQVFGFVIVTCGTAFLLLWTAAPLIARFYSEPRLIWIVRALALQFPISATQMVPQSLATRALEFRGIALVQLAATVIGAGVTVAMALMGRGVWALVAGSLTTAAGQALGMNLVEPFSCRPVFSLRGARGLLSFGGYATVSTVLWTWWSEADIFIGGKLLGKQSLGAYSISKQVASIPLQKISAIINQVALPALSRRQHDRDVIASQLVKVIGLLSLVSVPVMWGISAVSPELVTVVIGPKWASAVLPLQIIALVMPIRLVTGFVSTTLLSVGRPAVGAQNDAVLAIAMPLAFAVGAQWQLTGMALAWVAVYPALNFILVRRSLRVMEIPAATVLAVGLRPALAGLTMCGAVEGSRLLLMASGARPAVRLAVLVGVGAVAYCGVAWQTCRVHWQGCLALGKSMWK